MAQLLAEHRKLLRLACPLQPVSVQIDGARAERIGPGRTVHGGRRQHRDRRQAPEIALRPLFRQPLKGWRYRRQPQGLQRCSAE